jgi:hypothetical protein
VTEAAKTFMALGQKPDMYFWRSHDGLEVDLLIMIGGKLQAIEIKQTATPTTGHASPMQRFIAAAGDEAHPQGIVVCQTETQRTLPHGHIAMPWQLFPSWLRKAVR